MGPWGAAMVGAHAQHDSQRRQRHPTSNSHSLQTPTSGRTDVTSRYVTFDVHDCHLQCCRPSHYKFTSSRNLQWNPTAFTIADVTLGPHTLRNTKVNTKTNVQEALSHGAHEALLSHPHATERRGIWDHTLTMARESHPPKRVAHTSVEIIIGNTSAVANM